MVEVEAGALVERRLVVARIELAFEEVVVSSGFSIAQPGAGGAGASLDREQISRLPAFGEDLYRAVSTLPGTSSGDLSARFSVRGSLDTEVLARLDGIELHEPFHLRDYEGVFSIVDPGLIGRADLITGGMPVEFGERSAGALDMRSRSPKSSASELGISFTNLWFRNEGVFADGRARWLASGRRGFLDLVLEISGEGEEESGEGEEGDGGAPSPAYWDAFAKLEYDLSPRSRWAFHVLGSGDTLKDKENEDGEIEDYDTSYDSAYLWATHTWIPRDALAVATHLEGTRLARDRRIFSAEFDDEARARDQRDTTILGASQDWTWDRGGDRLVKFGFGAKRFTSDYDYENEISLQSLIADVRFQPPIGEFAFDGEISGTSWHAYVADRRRLGRLTTELGVRYDRDVLSESHVAPRLNLVYDGARWGEWRAGAGRFVQPQRTHELDVADGVTTLSASETSDGYYAGWSRDVSGYAVRVEGYYRRTNDPAPALREVSSSPGIPFRKRRRTAFGSRRRARRRAASSGSSCRRARAPSSGGRRTRWPV
ncbi:MAG: TonB-dependent receptor plug domain-containing protein [Acidobacteria bacterium]|nr:TonB-dependent receptor plug domain-containing protein [Acidobacteriota bacterium]